VPSSVMPPSNGRRKGSRRTGTLVVVDPADGSEPTMVYPYVLPDDWNDPVQVGSPVAPRRTAFTREARDCSASTSPELGPSTPRGAMCPAAPAEARNTACTTRAAATPSVINLLFIVCFLRRAFTRAPEVNWRCRDAVNAFGAEGLGFEPRVLAHNGFQDRPVRPLRHPSVVEATGVPRRRRS